MAVAYRCHDRKKIRLIFTEPTTDIGKMSCVFYKNYALCVFKILMTKNDRTHLTKRPTDLKQNGTQEMTPFSGTVFHTLSYDVFHFVACGSFKNHLIVASDWLSKNLNQSEGGFLSYHLQQNGPHHVKGY